VQFTTALAALQAACFFPVEIFQTDSFLKKIKKKRDAKKNLNTLARFDSALILSSTPPTPISSHVSYFVGNPDKE
jgi:hypothetical protein